MAFNQLFTYLILILACSFVVNGCLLTAQLHVFITNGCPLRAQLRWFTTNGRRFTAQLRCFMTNGCPLTAQLRCFITNGCRVPAQLRYGIKFNVSDCGYLSFLRDNHNFQSIKATKIFHRGESRIKVDKKESVDPRLTTTRVIGYINICQKTALTCVLFSPLG